MISRKKKQCIDYDGDKWRLWAHVLQTVSAATHCSTLQHTATHATHHTATHRNTPQHTAARHNTLHYTATHRNPPQHTLRHLRQPWCVVTCASDSECYNIRTATHCNTLQHTATHCNTLQHTATHRSTLQHITAHRNTPQHTATHCNTLQYTATHCSTLQRTLQRTNLVCGHTCCRHWIWGGYDQ